MRHVVLPQAVRRVEPPLLNDLVAMQKDVGLISEAGPIDAIRAAQIATAQIFGVRLSPTASTGTIAPRSPMCLSGPPPTSSHRLPTVHT